MTKKITSRFITSFAMKKKFLPLIVMLSMSSLKMTGHELDPTSHQANIVPSAEAWAMSRYGNPTPSLYTGAMSYSVPIYTYKDPDFTIPVSLDYHFDGYKLTARSGSVGMGWFLNCGGIITREVVGLPDEECIQINSQNFNCGYRFLYDGRGRDQADISAYESSFNNGVSGFELVCSSVLGNTAVMQGGFKRNAGNVLACNTPLLGNSNGISANLRDAFDFSSDIYHFSVFGMSGDFVLGPNGHTNVYNSSVPHGELTATYEMENGTVKIEISTSDGYVYTFRSHNDAGEIINFSCDPWFGHDYEHRPHLGDPSLKKSISAFKLSCIKAPNGRNVEFEYNNPACELICREIYRPRINDYDYVNGVGYFKGGPFVSTTSAVSHNLTGIKIDGNRIFEFNYSGAERAENGANAFNDGANYYTYFDPEITSFYNTPHPLRLSSACIYNRNNAVIESAIFEYTYTSSQEHCSPKMFLWSVTTNSGKTSFEYNHAASTDSYPSIDCFATDHWGYYRGEGTGLPFNPSSGTDWQTCQDTTLYYNFNNDGCSPSFTTTMYGALTKITYPTGGYSRIEYEQNDAGKRVDRKMDRGVVVEDNDGFPAGGVRVKKITEYDKAGSPKDSTSYKYEYSEGGSSGTIQWMPRYALKRNVVYIERDSVIQWDFGINWHIDPLPDSVDSCVFLTFNSQGVYSFRREAPVGYSHVVACKGDGSRIEYNFYDNSDCMDTFGGFPGWMYSKAASTVPPDNPHPETRAGSISFYTQCDTSSHLTISNILSPVTRSLSCIRGKIKEIRVCDSEDRPRHKTVYNYDFQQVARRTQMHDVLFGFVPYEVSFVSPLLMSTNTTEYFADTSHIVVSKLMTYNSHGQPTSCRENGVISGKRTDYEYYNNTMGGGRAHLLHKKTEYARHYGVETKTSTLEYFYDSRDIHNPYPVRLKLDVPGGASKELQLSYGEKYRLETATFPGDAYCQYLWDGNKVHIVEKKTNGQAMTESYGWIDLVGLASHSNPYGQVEAYTYDAKNRLQSVSKDGGKTVEYEYNVVNQ